MPGKAFAQVDGEPVVDGAAVGVVGGLIAERDGNTGSGNGVAGGAVGTESKTFALKHLIDQAEARRWNERRERRVDATGTEETSDRGRNVGPGRANAADVHSARIGVDCNRSRGQGSVPIVDQKIAVNRVGVNGPVQVTRLR